MNVITRKSWVLIIAVVMAGTGCGNAPDGCQHIAGASMSVSEKDNQWIVSIGPTTKIHMPTIEAANKLLKIAKGHSFVCRIGGEPPLTEGAAYLVNPTKAFLELSSQGEDCNTHDPASVRVLRSNGQWELRSKYAIMVAVTSEQQAHILETYFKANTRQCFIGRKTLDTDIVREVVTYWRP